MTDINRRAITARIKGTRGRILSLLREGDWTVDDLAGQLGLTDNAVRFHLDALERIGTVEKGDLRRSTGAGQPAVLYSLSQAGEDEFSRAYAPVLIAFLEELHERMSTAQVTALSRLAGGAGEWCRATAKQPWRCDNNREERGLIPYRGTRLPVVARSGSGPLRLHRRHIAGVGSRRRERDGAVRSFGTSEVLL